MKLPEINFGRAAAPRTAGLGGVMSEASAKRNERQAVFAGLQAVGEYKEERDLIRANAGYREAVNQYQMFAAQNPRASKEDLAAWAERALGDSTLFDSLDTSYFDQRGESLPRHVWFGLGMSRVMEQSKRNSSELITNRRAREKWGAHVDKVNSEEMVRITNQSVADAVQYEFTQTELMAEQAIDGGYHTYAAEILSADIWRHNPAKQQVLIRKNFVASKSNEVDSVIAGATSSEEIGNFLLQMSTEKWAAGLSPGEYLPMLKSVVSAKNAMSTAESKLESAAQDDLAMRLLIGLSDPKSPVGMAEVNAAGPDIGWQNLKTLTTAVNNQATNGGYTDPATKKSLGQKIALLRAGVTFTDESGQAITFQDSLAAIKSELIAAVGDPNTGASYLSLKDSNDLLKELQAVKEFPYKTEAYGAVVDDLRNRVLRAPTGTLASVIGDERSQLYANALTSLRQWIEANGGTAADVSIWQTENMPKFLEKEQQIALLEMPEGLDAWVVMKKGPGEFGVDHAATKDAFQQLLSDKLKEAGGDKSNPIYMNSERLYSSYLDWAKGRGE